MMELVYMCESETDEHCNAQLVLAGASKQIMLYCICHFSILAREV
jgi:hypothetical protein